MITATIDKKELAARRWLPRSVWPFHSFAINADGIDIAITDVGSGPVLLFVHTGSWSFIWRDLMVLLAKEFRCICFDAPGNGRSGMLPIPEITLERAARVTKIVIERLELSRFTLVVHDLGGISGLAGAARSAPRVQGIIGMNTFAWRPDLTAFRAMLQIMGSPLIRELDACTDFMGWIGSSKFGAGMHFDKASRHAFRAGTAAGKRRPFHTYMRDAIRCDDLYREIDAALRGPFAHLPYLTIFGERNDPFGFQQRWRSLVPRVEQHLVPNGNHFPMCDDPDLVAEIVRRWHKANINE